MEIYLVFPVDRTYHIILKCDIDNKWHDLRFNAHNSKYHLHFPFSRTPPSGTSNAPVPTSLSTSPHILLSFSHWRCFRLWFILKYSVSLDKRRQNKLLYWKYILEWEPLSIRRVNCCWTFTVPWSRLDNFSNLARTMNWWWRHQMETFSALLSLCAGNSPVTGEFLHKGQWRGALVFSLICTWINGWIKNDDAGGLRRHGIHYDVTVMWCRSVPLVPI